MHSLFNPSPSPNPSPKLNSNPNLTSVQVVDEKTDCLMASAEVPLRCVGNSPFELGAESYAVTQPTSKGRSTSQDRGKHDTPPPPPPLSAVSPGMRPCIITLWCVPPGESTPAVKHLFLISAAESALAEAFSVIRSSSPPSPVTSQLANCAHPTSSTGSVASEGSKRGSRLEGGQRRSRGSFRGDKQSAGARERHSPPLPIHQTAQPPLPASLHQLTHLPPSLSSLLNDALPQPSPPLPPLTSTSNHHARLSSAMISPGPCYSTSQYHPSLFSLIIRCLPTRSCTYHDLAHTTITPTITHSSLAPSGPSPSAYFGWMQGLSPPPPRDTRLRRLALVACLGWA